MTPFWQGLLIVLCVGVAAQFVLLVAMFGYFTSVSRRLRAHHEPHSRASLPTVPAQSEPSRVDTLPITSQRKTRTEGVGDCMSCNSLCCRYLSFDVDAPTTLAEHDWMRYVLSHEGVLVYVSDGQWTVEVRTPCSHIVDESRCGIYETRPKFCRDYSPSGCEQTADSMEDFAWENYWVSVDDYETWLRRTYGNEWREYAAEQRRINSEAGAFKPCSHKANGRQTEQVASLTKGGRPMNGSRTADPRGDRP